MNKIFYLVLLLQFNIIINFCNENPHPKNKKIALCTTATHRYVKFVEPLLESARQFFFPNHLVTYLIFTDSYFKHANDTKIIYLQHKPWPFSSMQRFEAYYKSKDILEQFDYVFACDADAEFKDFVEEKLLSDRVGTLHPIFFDCPEKADFEKNPVSTAYIKDSDLKHYFCGGFYGGSSKEFIKLVETNTKNILIDFNKNFIATWFDESHLNRYFVDNPPTTILTPSYCYPQNYWKWIKDRPFPFKPIYYVLDKGNNEVRS